MKTKTIIITTVGGRGSSGVGPVPVVRPATLARPLEPRRLLSVSPPLGTAAASAQPARSLSRLSPALLSGPVGSGTPRKRERLTHLTPEEKLNRRKLKNRIAAQTARDRKKLKMATLEVATTDMSAENEALLDENEALRRQNAALTEENARLRAELEESRAAPAETLGSAAFINAPLQREQVSAATLLSLLTTLLSLSSPGSSRTSSPASPTASATASATASVRPQLEEMRQALLKGHRLSSSQLQLLAQLTQSLWSKGRLKC